MIDVCETESTVGDADGMLTSLSNVKFNEFIIFMFFLFFENANSTDIPES